MDENKLVEVDNKFLMLNCADSKRNVKNADEIEKGRWVEHLVKHIKLMSMNLWKDKEQIKILTNGFSRHHEKKT